ncbi:AGAP002903-PA-like protein [Anopheles sinensis]|uniref:AGAP002903-PA-like protein n=1 Tax=Anopheles sinensis TaxID=74873 RepID=A0A084VE35_ANOSI|nr:AGAP002903-PA-like protein [Anopheles sinensis]
MTQLEDDDLLNNLLKIPGTIIIYNNDMSSYDYVLNAHNVTLPLTPATSTAGSAASEQSVDDLNSSASIDTDLAGSPVPTYHSTGGTLVHHPQLQPDSPASIMMETPGYSELDQSFGSVGYSGPQDDPASSQAEEEMVLEGSELDEEPDETDPRGTTTTTTLVDEEDSEPELTNLSWLTELKNITNLTPSDVPLTDLPTARFNKFIAQVRRSRETYDKRKEQYTSPASSLEKPPFNYAQIIAMAMLEEGRMTLKQICKWIQEKFSYYKVHKNWNNSIRHNLSLSFFFTKVQRAKDEKGKGGYWELSMDVSKSERRRIRIRQRNKGFSATGGNNAAPGYASAGNNRRTSTAPRMPKGSTGAGSGLEANGQGTNNNNNNDQTVNNNLPPDKHPDVTVPCDVIEQEIVLATSSETVSCPTGATLLTALDSNNNNCPQQQQSIIPVPIGVANSEPVPVQIDIIDNYSKPLSGMDMIVELPTPDPTPGTQPMDVQMPHTGTTGSNLVAQTTIPTDHLVVNEDQLIHASALVENCTINFDSIMNGDNGASIFSNLNVDEIFSDNEIPQPANDDIIVPFFSNVQQVQTGPNVVVETIPYYLPDMGNFDESDFGNLININEQEISDEFLNEHGFL